MPMDYTYDMLGNVGVWCYDYGHENYQGAPQDCTPWIFPSTPFKICRGGSFFRSAIDCRQTRRILAVPDTRDIDLGFRVCKTIP